MVINGLNGQNIDFLIYYANIFFSINQNFVSVIISVMNFFMFSDDNLMFLDMNVIIIKYYQFKCLKTFFVK